MKTLLLAFTMNLVPMAPVDVLRFLRVPGVVWVLRRKRFCSDAKHGVRRLCRRF
jgi:hypothetical protein